MHLNCDLLPIWTFNDSFESDVEKDTTDGKSPPEAFYSHLIFERKSQSKWQSDSVIAYQCVDSSIYLPSESSDDTTLHSVNRVEENVEHDDSEDVHNDENSAVITCEKMCYLSAEYSEDDKYNSCDDDVENECES